MGVGQRSGGHATETLAVSNTAFLPIGGDVEKDEEHQVRGEDTDPGKGGKLLAGALACIGQPGEVRRGKVGPRCEIDKTWSDC